MPTDMLGKSINSRETPIEEAKKVINIGAYRLCAMEFQQ